MRRTEALARVEGLRQQLAELYGQIGRDNRHHVLHALTQAEAQLARIRTAAPPSPEAQDAAPWMRGPTCPKCHQVVVPMSWRIADLRRLQEDALRDAGAHDGWKRLLANEVSDAETTDLPLWCTTCGAALDGADEQIEAARVAWAAWERHVRERGGR